MIDKLIKGLIAIVAILLLGYIVFLKLPQSSVSTMKVVATVSAGELYDEFVDDEQSAETKYLGKAVLVKGKIDDKYSDETSAPVVILENDYEEPIVLITLELSEEKKLASYEVGDVIEIKAQCSGMLMEVTLNKGIIVN